MKNSRKFLERMNDIDDELLLRADKPNVKEKKHKANLKWVIIAAVLCFISIISFAVAAFYIREGLKNGNIEENEDVLQVPISDVYWIDTRERNNKDSLVENSAIVWPWNCRDVYNQYTELSIGGKEYRSRSSYYGGEIFANQIGKKIADAEAKGYDLFGSAAENKEIYYTKKCEVFEIIGVDSDRILAVKYEGYDGYYAFMNEERKSPETFGGLMDSLDLTNNIKLNSFYCDENRDHISEHYALSNEVSAELWKILKECADAPILSDTADKFWESKISFAINSNTLGVYNLSFSICDGGYLSTNIENYQYVYNIGTDATNKIIDIAMKNKLVVLLPEKQYLVGTVTEIGEDYIKINDSVLMKNAEEGIEFTVYATNMNIRRYIISGYLNVGDTVRVTHGYLLKESYTEIKNAVDLEECIITSGKDVLIPE